MTNFTTTEQGLLNAILANPDDIAVRFVYADWLDENGQPERAWMIRDAPALKWYRRRYGKWAWWYERPHSITGETTWGEVVGTSIAHAGSQYPSQRARNAAHPLFPETWRRNLNTVIYRNGFVDELGVDRFHSNTFRLMETQPVRTITTTAEAMLEVADLFDKCKSLRKIRLTTLPRRCTARRISNIFALEFAGVDRTVTIPATTNTLYTFGPVVTEAEICYRLGRVVGHYLTPHGITVELPASD